MAAGGDRAAGPAQLGAQRDVWTQHLRFQGGASNSCQTRHNAVKYTPEVGGDSLQNRA